MRIDPATLTFEQFQDIISSELAVPREKVVRKARLIDDLMVDSIRMVEMMLKLEEQGMSIPIEMAWSIETVEDAFEAYKQQGDAGAAARTTTAAAAGGD